MLEHAAATLAALATVNVKAVAAETAGMLPTLVRLLARRGPVAQWTAALLGNLAGGSPDGAASILAAGAIPTLVSLLDTGAEGEKSTAAGALINMAQLEFAEAITACLLLFRCWAASTLFFKCPQRDCCGTWPGTAALHWWLQALSRRWRTYCRAAAARMHAWRPHGLLPMSLIMANSM